MADRKHVLLVVRWPGGGIRTFIRYVYKDIDSSKWHLTILAPQSEGIQLMREDLVGVDVDFVTVTCIPTDGSSGAFNFTKAIISTLNNQKFDLVHSHGFTSAACLSIPAYVKAVPHLMTSHDVINENQFAGLRGFIKKAVLGQLFKIPNKIQSVSYDAEKNLLKYFPKLQRNSKCIVIPNGIEVERFLGAKPRNFREEFNLKEDVFLIGFLGRFMSQKGFKYLIEAVEILSKHNDLEKKPIVVTFGDGCFAGRERREIDSRGLSDYFIALPFAANVASSIKGLDVVAMPSLWEACGLLAMESLVCGTPFIGTDCIGLREVIQDTPAYQVPIADSIALASAILHELNHSRRSEFLKFTEMAAIRYDVKNASNEIFELYAQMSV